MWANAIICVYITKRNPFCTAVTWLGGWIYIPLVYIWDISCKETGGLKVDCNTSEYDFVGLNLSFIYFCTVFFQLFLLGTVCVPSPQEYLNLIDCNLYYWVVRCCTTYEHVFVYTCHVFCCCCSVCCYTAVVGAAVRHRLPDGKNCCCGSLHLIPVFSFSSFKHNERLMYVPLGSTVAFAASIYL